MATGNITLPDELLSRLEELARAENKTADDVVSEAVKQHLVRRWWDRTQRESNSRRRNMTDEEVDDAVARAILDHRQHPPSF